MAKYTLTIQSDDASDILNALTVEVAAVSETESAAPAKRGRKSRGVELKPVPVEEKAAEPVAEETPEDDFSDLSDEPASPPESKPAPTKQEVNDAFIVLGKAKGRPAIDKVIKALGYTKFSEIPESAYGKTMTSIEEATKG